MTLSTTGLVQPVIAAGVVGGLAFGAPVRFSNGALCPMSKAPSLAATMNHAVAPSGVAAPVTPVVGVVRNPFAAVVEDAIDT